MSEIDFEELDKAVKKAIKKDGGNNMANKKVADIFVNKAQVQAPKKIASRGRYMDMVHPSSDMRPHPVRAAVKPTVAMANKAQVQVPKKVEKEPEFGIIEDVRVETSTTEEIRAEKDFIAEPRPFFSKNDEEETPDANNYSLGGRSPFLTDAKVEKRPLGSVLPDGSTYGVRSTKNVYSQRTYVGRSNIPEKKQPVIISENKKASGWAWTLVIFLIIVVGGALGLGAYFLFANW